MQGAALAPPDVVRERVRTSQRVTGGGCRAPGEPRDFGGLGPASPEGSEMQQAALAPPDVKRMAGAGREKSD
jgi:hypothetical protein